MTKVPEVKNKRTLWKLYGILLSIFLVTGYINVLPFSTLIAIDFAITMFGFWGLWMFAFSRKFLAKWVWSCWAIVQPAWDIYINIIQPPSPPDASELLLMLVVLLPMYAGLFIYGYGSHDIWEDKPDEPDKPDKPKTA